MASDSMGFSCVELEGDVRSIVQKLSGSGVDRSSIGAIIADGKALFGFFQQCQFKFITRKGNQAAHYLAKHGFTNDDADYFRGGPVLLYASLIMDCFSLVVSSWSFSQLHFDDLQACC
ncbi:hypothetical protein Gotur_014897 [Gossypium turneri]